MTSAVLLLLSLVALATFAHAAPSTDDQGSSASNHLIVTTALSPPFMMLKTNSSPPNTNDQFEGYLKDVLDEIAPRVGFTYTLQLAKNNGYGYKNSNGEWKGMIGEVLRKEVDMAMADLTITSAREEAVDFTHPFMNTGVSIILRQEVANLSQPLKSLEDLSRQTNIKYASTGVTRLFLSKSTIPFHTQIYESVMSDPSNLVSSVKEGIDKALSENYAFFMEDHTADYITRKHCNLIRVDGQLVSRDYAIAVQRNSPLRKQLNLAILSLKESGRLTNLYNKWWKQSGNSCN